MSEGKIGLLLLGEVCGVVGDLLVKLVGREGPVFAGELKKFVLKQPCWADDKSAVVQSVPIPEIGVEFDLSLEPTTGLEMVRLANRNPDIWRFLGQEVTEPRTGRFKLVRLEGCCGLSSVKRKINEGGGVVPMGQWCRALLAEFGGIDRKGPICVADDSWVEPRGLGAFPYISEKSEKGLDFSLADDLHPSLLRWLVRV